MKEKMLEGKVAIVSGASYGMGETMAELFAKEGAKVVMTARGKEKLEAAVNRLKEQGLEVTGVVADNKNLEDVKNVIRTALTVYGNLDIVINNAAIGEQKMIDETDDEWLEHVYQTNVFGPFRFIREALKVFLFCQRRPSFLRGILYFLERRNQYADQKRSHASYQYQHPHQRRGSGCYRNAGPSGKQSRRTARRRKDAGVQQTLRVFPRPGMRPHGSG